MRMSKLRSVPSCTARTGIIKDSHSQVDVASHGAREILKIAMKALRNLLLKT